MRKVVGETPTEILLRTFVLWAASLRRTLVRHRIIELLSKWIGLVRYEPRQRVKKRRWSETQAAAENLCRRKVKANLP
jgi:hypothetical protein